MKSICGVDCTGCGLREGCGGCAETKGRPFGGACLVADRLKEGTPALCAFQEKLMGAFNALSIQDMDELRQLHALKGSLVNLTYTLPNGQAVQFWEDNKIYLGGQLAKKGSNLWYGMIADETHLMVSQYRGYGEEAEIVVFQRWR